MIGRIYCIRSHQTTNIYIGSTSQILCKRLQNHKIDYKYYLQGKSHYITSFEIIQYEDAYIELIEENEFKNKQELQKREGEIIRQMDCVNKNIAGRTQKEYVEELEELKCKYCPLFFCKLKSDYKRHIQTKTHLENEKEIKEKEKEKELLFNYHIYYVMWSKKINKVNKQFIDRALFPRHIYEMKETLEIIKSKINKL